MYGDGFDAGGYAAEDAASMAQALLGIARLAKQQLDEYNVQQAMPAQNRRCRR